jgi:acetylcholinesterase
LICKFICICRIHGGGFQTGSSTSKNDDPKMFVAETNIIYVTVEYRLSIFGFLFMDHEDAPGNQGLLDQALAIKWIYENIVYFGGDKSRITVRF